MKVQKSFLFGIIWIDRKTARCPLAVAARKGLLQKPLLVWFVVRVHGSSSAEWETMFRPG